MKWAIATATIALIAIIAALIWLNVMLWMTEYRVFTIIVNIFTAIFLIVYFLGTLDIVFGIDVLNLL